jgi:hypothetical protein
MELLAYLDPATGSLFIQVLIGGILAGTVVMRNYMRSIVSKFKLVFARQKTDQA